MQKAQKCWRGKDVQLISYLAICGVALDGLLRKAPFVTGFGGILGSTFLFFSIFGNNPSSEKIEPRAVRIEQQDLCTHRTGVLEDIAELLSAAPKRKAFSERKNEIRSIELALLLSAVA